MRRTTPRAPAALPHLHAARRRPGAGRTRAGAAALCDRRGGPPRPPPAARSGTARRLLRAQARPPARHAPGSCNRAGGRHRAHVALPLRSRRPQLAATPSPACPRSVIHTRGGQGGQAGSPDANAAAGWRRRHAAGGRTGGDGRGGGAQPSRSNATRPRRSSHGTWPRPRRSGHGTQRAAARARPALRHAGAGAVDRVLPQACAAATHCCLDPKLARRHRE